MFASQTTGGDEGESLLAAPTRPRPVGSVDVLHELEVFLRGGRPQLVEVGAEPLAAVRRENNRAVVDTRAQWLLGDRIRSSSSSSFTRRARESASSAPPSGQRRTRPAAPPRRSGLHPSSAPS